MKCLLTCLLLCFVSVAEAQHVLRLIVKNEDNKGLPRATIRWTQGNRSVITDTTGSAVIENIPAGEHQFIITHIGYEEKEVAYVFPLPGERVIEIILEEAEEEHEEEILVTTTRISRTIANIPTRVEVISGEELTEKGNMRPGEIRMLLSESTGIQVQQTSATSFNAGIRIQGLDGRYTQMLRDGYPLYAGFAGGLSIMQIAPLDLRQVEVIKGSASTLYGGGAIAGLVNLISKTPGDESELSFLANGTSAGGLDLSAFYSERYGKAGLTVFASRNSNAPYDPADIGLTAIPKFERYTVNPRLFLYGSKTSADLGVTYITEDRTGGSMQYIKEGGAGYFEHNNTDRFITQLGISHRMNEKAVLQFKNSYSRFDRVITVPNYRFDALQQSSFSELTWTRRGVKADWVIGSNLLTEDLEEKTPTGQLPRNYHYKTYGLFVQNAWTVSEKLVLETGARADYVDDFGLEILPRISIMVRVSPSITTRVGGGFGYKTPTIFTEETERMHFMDLLPVNVNATRNERSAGANWDINYRTAIGDVQLTLNHLFFYTRLNHPLTLTGAPGGKVELKNANGHLDTKGMETNARLVFGNFKLFVGYTLTDANTHFNNREWLPLTAKHRLNNVLMYEIEDNIKLGLEAYYFSRQRLTGGATGKPYWVTGFMAEKIWERISVFVNFENFTNTRQTRFDTIFTGTIDNPTFRDIYAPVEGFVVNGGIKLRL